MAGADPDRRDHLTEAIARYILASGLADLSLRPLAAELGTNPRMLLYYFGSKEELLAEGLRRIRLWQQEVAAEWFAEDQDDEPATMLRRSWEWLSSKEAEPFMRLFFEVYGLALQDPGRYASFLEHVVIDWLPVAETVLERAGVDERDRRSRATLLIAAHRGLLLDLLATGDKARIDASYEQLVADLNDTVFACK
jgi:AcrR family transcriptional regulator